jgi:hypothetical protein
VAIRVVILITLLTSDVFAQSGDPAYADRAQQIQAQRLNKVATATNPGPGFFAKTATFFDRIVESTPVMFGAGGLGPGAGFGVATDLPRNNSTNKVGVHLFGKALLNGFYTAGTGLQLRDISGRDLRLSIEGSYADASQLQYYGPGPHSSINNRTDYRREETLFKIRFDRNQDGRWSQTCDAAELLMNVGPGTNDNFPSTNEVFGPAQAPGIDHQTNYLVGGCSVSMNLTDFKADPHKGTFASAGYARYHAQDIQQFSFNHVALDAAQYFPFWNEKRVIALLGSLQLNPHSSNEVVPFYMQPSLGTDTALRGFRRDRFYDENAIALTAEYRWEIATGIDMAAFGDAGNVFHRPSDLNLSDLETSAGFGFRFKYRRAVVGRVDIGFSHEGVQVWVRFGRLF